MSCFVVVKNEKPRLGKSISADVYASITSDGVSYRVLRVSQPPKGRAIATTTFEPSVQELLESCYRFYQPPLVLAGRDIEKSYHRYSIRRQQLSVTRVLKDFETATRFWIKHQERFLLVPVIGETRDLELPNGSYVWVLGYHDDEQSIWDQPKAFVINTSGLMDFVSPELLGITHKELIERFADTPLYWTASARELDPNFCAPSLM